MAMAKSFVSDEGGAEWGVGSEELGQLAGNTAFTLYRLWQLTLCLCHSKSCHTFDICFGVEHELTVSQAS